ncbi:hypothetical protein [Paracoccus sp. 228]|uniref:hypothetical protein n=1 Tax=Paracoccus sp. 228 TaxID=1192054 RepID=UPI0005E9625A|nr:hypothetical protein [Paracoccus sp. 228]KIX19055.1 hypothetical protein SY26_02745 [Paracoccus sp. 228]
MRRLARLTLLIWSLATVAVTGWMLSQNPFAAPLVDRGLDQARAALTRAVADRATPDWLIPRLTAALDAGDRQQVQMLMDLARDQGMPLPPDLRARADAALAVGMLDTLSDCGTCMRDVTACPSLSLVAACTLPFELSPAGDAAALIRQGGTWATGGDPDGIEAALATLGLAATAGTLVTAGSSLSIKGAATTLRVARRADALSPGMTRALSAAARSPAPTRALSGIAGDLRTIGRQASVPELLPILRLADDPDDLRRLARLSEAAGPDTTRVLTVLGKSDSLRLMRRLADAAMAAAALIALVLGQMAALLGAGVQMALRRGLRPNPARRMPPPLRSVAVGR